VYGNACERPQRRMAAALACAADGTNTMWSTSTMPAGLGMAMRRSVNGAEATMRHESWA